MNIPSEIYETETATVNIIDISDFDPTMSDVYVSSRTKISINKSILLCLTRVRYDSRLSDGPDYYDNEIGIEGHFEIIPRFNDKGHSIGYTPQDVVIYFLNAIVSLTLALQNYAVYFRRSEILFCTDTTTLSCQISYSVKRSEL